MRNVVVIVQARVNSRRFPLKALAKIGDSTCLEHVLKRCRLSQYPVVLATPWTKENDCLAEIAESVGCMVYRGPETHVLARYLGAANVYGAESIIRITADCPFVSPEHIRTVAHTLIYNEVDFVSNVYPVRSWPRGFDVEGFSKWALERACEGHDPMYNEHEHVTLFMQRTYQAVNLTQKVDFSEWRMVLDTPEDFTWFQSVAEVLDTEPPHPTLDELLDAIGDHRIIPRYDTPRTPPRR